MTRFDFIDSATKGYEFVWKERGYLSRVILPVLFVKIACLFTVFIVGAQDNYLRQGLINMPGFVIEAIFVAGLIRYIIYKEPIFVWGKLVTPPKSEIKPEPYSGIMSRKQSIQSAVALYLLMRIIEVFLISFNLENTQPLPISSELPEDVMQISPAMASIMMFLALVIFTWIFKFFWLFIPTGLGYSMSEFLKKLNGMRGSISMIAAWLVCSLPLMTLFSALLQIISSSFIEGSAGYLILTSILKVIAEMSIISLQVAAMTYGIHKILSGKKD